MAALRLFLLLIVGSSIAHQVYAEVVLFADDAQVSERNSLKRVVEPAEKLPEPVIRGDQRWEQNPYAYGSFAYDEAEQTYKGWYQSLNGGVSIRTPVLYNLSKDGREWVRPQLGLVEFEGNKDNNIVMPLQRLCSPSVIKVPEEVGGEHPYRMAFWDIRNGSTYDGGGGTYTAISKDGVHWQEDCESPRLVAEKRNDSASDVLDLMYDAELQKYVVHAKCWKWQGEKALYRLICRSESTDFREWSTPEVVFDPRAEDESQPQTYGMPVFKYEGQYFGLLRIYHKPGNETIEIELAHSRDDKIWHRIAPGTAFLPVGEKDTWDDGMVFAAPPVVRDEQMDFFYGGWDGPHNVGGRKANIGLATSTVGRLVALTPEGNSGAVITQLAAGEHQPFSLNVDTKQGTVRAALLDETGAEVPGYGLEDSPIVQGDHANYVLRWNGTAINAPLPDKVFLKVELSGDACLYEIRY
ncbi:glycoside hydrolase family protein [Aeoliella mucimassa]|nr:hypothetical protein [Aeoliella mucimassa]